MNKKTGVAVLMLVKVDTGTRRNARAHNSKCVCMILYIESA